MLEFTRNYKDPYKPYAPFRIKNKQTNKKKTKNSAVIVDSSELLGKF